MLESQNWNRIEETWANWRTAWEQNQTAPVPVAAAPAPPPTICIAMKQDGRQCTKASTIEGRCTLHHGVHRRIQEKPRIRAIFRELNNLFRMGARAPDMREHLATAQVGLSPQGVTKVQRRLEYFIENIHFRSIQIILNNNGGTLEQAVARIQLLVMEGEVTPHIGEALMQYAEAVVHNNEWVRQQQEGRARARVWDAEHREAALANDSQNVHTAEITTQMRDGVALLCAVPVPDTQNTTASDIKASWVALGSPPAEVEAVWKDLVTWWNKKTIYKENDKLYKRCLRGLWCTITGFKGEVRTELEKRLWDECRDGALPYSVCTQGHIARLCNVLIGFDDAFKPPVPVGEVLQQKMAAIYAMDVAQDRQIELAKEVLSELKVPEAEHNNWLEAF